MNRNFFTYVLLGLAVIGVAGCDNMGDTLSDVDSSGSPALASEVDEDGINKTILGYEVNFSSRTYDGEQTTFSYKVTRPNSGTAAPNYFFLESPECAGEPVSFQPSPSGGMYIEDDLEGIRWTSTGIAPGATATFSVTYDGEIHPGIVLVGLKVGYNEEHRKLLGACKSSPYRFNLSGSVFIDGDGLGTFDSAVETGFGNVTVKLFDHNDNFLRSTKTADDGSYLFQVAKGDYTIKVLESTPHPDDFNEQLYTYFDPFGATDIPVYDVCEDAPNNNFGFAPDDKKIAADLKSGTIPTTAEKVTWWTREFRFAIKGIGNPRLSTAELTGFLEAVEDLRLPEIFDFDDSDPFGDAFEILNRPAKSEQDQLERELLAAELNFVAGFGSNTREFDLAVFAFAESDWLVRFGSTAKLSGDAAFAKALLASTTMLKSYNDSGTGTGSGRGSLKRGEGE